MLDSLRSQLWPVPLTAIVLAIAAGQFLPDLDRKLGGNGDSSVSALLFGGGSEAASNLLQTIAGAMITVTALTFSLTVVTLQLASSQFSPRLLRTFTRDRIVHGTLALFLATFVFALTVLRSVRNPSGAYEGFVPRISTTVAFLLAVASVLALVGFLSHLARQIRVESMLQTVFDEAAATLKRVFSDAEDPGQVRPSVQTGRGQGFRPIESRSSGFLLTVDYAAVCAAATASGVFIVFESVPGDSLVRGVPFARARHGAGGELNNEALAALADAMEECVATGFERTSAQDATLGLQQLLDIAARALSPGINDATTAVHAIGHVSALLCGLMGRATGAHLVCDEDGIARVLVPRPGLEDMLDLTMRQLLRYAMDDPRAAERSIKMLAELAWVDHTGLLTSSLAAQGRATAQALQDSPINGAETGRLLALLDAEPPTR
ncbi:DUF2254 domain-containing protein [Paeniglutamicibacter cryotolerans]|uniref:DUF2254 domain-containing protein n=1 Tax=Paeniglutamicibacter cryotolerans TaxID=670079 RepID=UPI0038990EC1